MSAAASLYAPGIPWYATRSFFLCPVVTSSPSPTPDVAVASPLPDAEIVLTTYRDVLGTMSAKVCAWFAPVAPPGPRIATAILWRDAVDRARNECRGIARTVAVTVLLAQ